MFSVVVHFIEQCQGLVELYLVAGLMGLGVSSVGLVHSRHWQSYFSDDSCQPLVVGLPSLHKDLVTYFSLIEVED
jgi:hypothetical protein